MRRSIVFKIAIASIAFFVGVASVFFWLSRPYLESFEDVDFTKIPVVDYCEMRNNPEKYSGRIFRMDADLYGYQHGIFFYDENCWSPVSEKSMGENFRTAVSLYKPNSSGLWESLGDYAYKKDQYLRIKAVGRVTYEPSKNADSHPYGGGIEDRTAFRFDIHSIESIEQKTK